MPKRQHHLYWPPKGGWTFRPNDPSTSPPGFWEGATARHHEGFNLNAPSTSHVGRFAGWGEQDSWKVILADGRCLEAPFPGLVVLTEKAGSCPYWQKPIAGGMKKGMEVNVTMLGGKPWIAMANEDRLARGWRSIRQAMWVLGWRPRCSWEKSDHLEPCR